MKKIAILGTLGVIVLVAIIAIGMYFSYNNTEVDLRQQAEAQRGKIEAVYDNMYKVIHQTNEVKNSYSSDFKEVCNAVFEGRYGKGDGTLMKWIKEENPKLDPSMYGRVMDAIMIERDNFTKQQVRMLDIIREHSALCKKFPGKWFISNKTEIEYTVVSSTRSKAVMQSGIDDNLEL